MTRRCETRAEGRKIRAAQEVAQRLDSAANTPHGFRVFRDAILELAAA